MYVILTIMIFCVQITPKACISSMRSIVYHQRLAVVYHHCERVYSLRLMIYTFGDDIPTSSDDMPSLSQWIKKEVTFGRQKLLLFWRRRRDLKGSAPTRVVCRELSPALARLCSLALWLLRFEKTILNRFFSLALAE